VQAASCRAGRTLLISGPRQIGKSSLLARVYQHARDSKIRTVYLDFQLLGHEQLSSLDNLLIAIANQIYDDLSLNFCQLEQAPDSEPEPDALPEE